MSETWTIKRILIWSDGFLSKHGSESPRLDAELLLGEALALRRLDLYLHFDRPLQADELAAYKTLVCRRARHEPVAYILGRKGFHAVDLQVGPGVLVPRPETELLVDRVLQFAAGDDAPQGAALDLCTGSGAIALALAEAWRADEADRPIVGTDISEQGLCWARRNAEALAPAQPIDWRQGDLFGALRPDERFAIIVSNPPYVRSDVLATLNPTVRDHEPMLALDGGDDGMAILNRITAEAPQWLLPGGLLAVELGSREQGESTVQAMTKIGMVGARHEAIGPGPTGVVTGRWPMELPMAAAVNL